MVSKDFLSRILPDGFIVVAKPKGRGFQHYVCENPDQAAKQAQAIDREGAECYFGLGSLKAPRVFNEGKQKWEVRVGTNIAQLRSLFADVDIAADDPDKYATASEAIGAFKQFCKQTQFPPPLIVSSGHGLHLYWPMTKAVDAALWRPVAAQFKAALLSYGLKIDPTRTADASSILRVPGTHNYKHNTTREVAIVRDAGPYTPSVMRDAVNRFSQLQGMLVAVPPPPPAAVSALALLPSNTIKVYAKQDPALFQPILLGCPQMQYLAKTGGKREPSWYAGLQLSRFCEEPQRVARFISDAYEKFDAVEMQRKLDQLEANDIGPTTCKRFQDAYADPCNGCQHKGKIESPIVLGRQVKEAPAPVLEVVTPEGTAEIVVIPNPPFPYARRLTGGIVVRQPDVEGVPTAPQVVHDYDMYPVKRTYSERRETEATVWRVKQPITGWTEVMVEQKMLSEPQTLHGVMMSKGVYIPPSRVKLMVSFMVAYISELQKQSVVETAFSRLGWRDDGTFVMAERAYHKDGTTTPHRSSQELRQEMPGLVSAGTLEGWKSAIQFYNNAGYHAHRFLFYTSFGAPLMHMTGYHGAIVNATGKPGTGKSTTLLAINSVWGHPGNLMVNGTKGGTTPNALQTLLSIHNNIPFCLDEITRMDPRTLGDLAISVNQGQGKLRNTRAGSLNATRLTWSTLMASTSNSDVYSALAGDRGDATAEAMRAFQIPLVLSETHSKAEADHFAKVGIAENYGLACELYMSYVAAHYSDVKQLVFNVMQVVDRKGAIAPSERFWSAVIAVNIAGAIIARKLGLIEDFPVEDDCKWATGQISLIRKTMHEHISSPREVLAEYLDSRVSETLTLSNTGSNIAPRIDNTPRGALTIRHEVDNGLVWMMKSAFRQYCSELGLHFTDIQEELEKGNVLVDRNVQKVLGAGTDYSKGQVRCWMINLKELEK